MEMDQGNGCLFVVSSITSQFNVEVKVDEPKADFNDKLIRVSALVFETIPTKLRLLVRQNQS